MFIPIRDVKYKEGIMACSDFISSLVGKKYEFNPNARYNQRREVFELRIESQIMKENGINLFDNNNREKYLSKEQLKEFSYSINHRGFGIIDILDEYASEDRNEEFKSLYKKVTEEDFTEECLNRPNLFKKEAEGYKLAKKEFKKFEKELKEKSAAQTGEINYTSEEFGKFLAEIDAEGNADGTITLEEIDKHCEFACSESDENLARRALKNSGPTSIYEIAEYRAKEILPPDPPYDHRRDLYMTNLLRSSISIIENIKRKEKKSVPDKFYINNAEGIRAIRERTGLRF